ncbi:MAG: SpoIIE family protein phosphatase [Chloroflexi bacterium]|nr:SpoIIE family protein phosphatase [Chloroflexota bacterium]
MRHTFFATLYSVALGLTGVGFLVGVTRSDVLLANAAPLAFFAALSFMLKRAGFHVAPQVTHSLVGIIDLAALFVFGPILGAWVAASSGFVYLFLNAWRRDKHSLRDFLEIPLFNAGLKVGMCYAASHVYALLGGQFAPRMLTPETLPAFLAAVVTWFALDHLGWGLLEYLRGGATALVAFLRTILVYSLLMELLPLPLAIVIAVVYTSLDRGIFLIMALGLFCTAIVVQRFADASAHLVRRRNDLTVLYEFGQALSQAAFDSDKITEVLCAHAQRIVPCDLCQIEFFDREGPPEAETRIALQATASETRHPNQPAPTSPLFDYFSKHRQPIRALDVYKPLVYPLDGTGSAVAASEKVTIAGRQARSALFVPMLAGEELIGVLSLFAIRARVFHPIHASNLAAMAAQAAVAIQNARLYAVERQRATQLAIVSDVSRQVAQVLDIDELLQQVVNSIRERFGYAKVHIFTVDGDAGYAVFRASSDPRSAAWRDKGWRLRLGLEGIVGWVAALGEPHIVDDVRKEPRFILDPDEQTSDTRSEIAVPLIVGKETVGVLDVQNNAVNAFGDEDLFILKTLAAQVAIAIEDARLFNSQKEEAWYLNVMLQVAQNLSQTASLDEALETVVRITPLLVGVARCAILLYDPANEAFVSAKAYGLSDEQDETLRHMRFRADDYGALSKLRQEMAPVVIQDPTADQMIRPEIRELFTIHALLIAPLITRGELVGAMLVDQGTRSRQFNPHEIQVVMGIANQVAVAIEGARLTSEAEGKKRLEYELGLARQIQESFLPDACPLISDYEICSQWQTAREVGGDFYDFIPLTGGRWGIVIADVSDKGMAAALFMALARTIIRTMAIGKPTPHEAIDRANDVILTDAHSEMFVTVFYAVLDPARASVTYVNAGHNPPLLYRAATRQVTTLKEHGIALGVIPNISLHDCEITAEPGDVLLLYTDGVTEALNAREEEFGADRLASIVAASGHLSSDKLVDEILQSVAEFTGGGPNSDDLTIVAIKRRAEQAGEPSRTESVL